MKRSPTVDELKFSAREARDKTAWFSSPNYTNVRRAVLEESLELQRRWRVRAGLLLWAAHIFSESEAKLQENETTPIVKCVEAVTAQAALHAMQDAVLNPKVFAERISKYFSGKRDLLEQFARLTFPSIFSFFVYHELADLGVTLVKEIVELNSLDVAALFVVSLFEFTPHFMANLITAYQENMGKAASCSTPFRHFDCFIEGLRFAVRYLTKKHFEVARLVLERSESVFIEVFVKRLFMRYVEFMDRESPLLSVFNCLANGHSQITIDLIKKTLTEPRHEFADELSLIGGFGALRNSFLEIVLSPYELGLILDMMKGVQKVSSRVKRECLVSKNLCSVKMFLNVDSLKVENLKYDKINIVPLGPKPVFKRENEEFVRAFEMITHQATILGTEKLAFFDPTLTWDCNKRQIGQFVDMVALFQSTDFVKYCYMKILGDCWEAMTDIDAVISLIEARNWIFDMTMKVSGFNETVRDWVAGVVMCDDVTMDIRRRVMRFAVTNAAELNELCDMLMRGMQDIECGGPNKIILVWKESLRIGHLSVGARIVEYGRLIQLILKQYGEERINDIIWDSLPETMYRKLIETFCVYMKYFRSDMSSCSDDFCEHTHGAWTIIYSVLRPKILSTSELRQRFDAYISTH